MTVRSRDIKSVSKDASSKASAINIGGQVPAGMKRWVTFVMIDGYALAGAKPVKAYFASVGVSNPTKASLIATGNRKYMIDIRATGVKRGTANVAGGGGPPFMCPRKIDPDNPLFSIAASKWLGVYASQTTASLFVQYFDE